jgi:hypothetical protein
VTYHTTSTAEQLATWNPVRAYDGAASKDKTIPLQGQDRPGYTGDTDVDMDNVYGYDAH